MGKTKHATESRDRSIKESICAEKGCKFFGQLAQQGVCHTSSGDLIDWDRLAQHEQREEAELEVFRKKYKGKEYVRWLESMYLCAQLNWQGTLDECIRLRRDNALLRLKTKRKR